MSGFVSEHAGAEVRVSPNFGPRRDGMRPDMIVLHYTGMQRGEAAEMWLCNPESEVSSHYIVHEDGRIVQMVREADRAWHAGRSSWRGVTDIEAVIALCAGISMRHGVAPERVLAHSDVAPGRKRDPGEKFPWAALHAAGIGHLVPPAPVRGGRFLTAGESGEPVEALQSMLALYGYGLEITGFFDAATQAVVEAFQRHFRPALVDGVADRSTIETLHLLLSALPGRLS